MTPKYIETSIYRNPIYSTTLLFLFLFFGFFDQLLSVTFEFKRGSHTTVKTKTNTWGTVMAASEGRRWQRGKGLGGQGQRSSWKKNVGREAASTLFVDDLPENLGRNELFNCFNRFGRVLDVFIPSKRSGLGTRFGFVRLDCKEAIMACSTRC
ncbi:hypothetical protein Dimus_022909 [Dionaea muscipula]